MPYTNSYHRSPRSGRTTPTPRISAYRSAERYRHAHSHPTPRTLPQLVGVIALLIALAAAGYYAVNTLGTVVKGAQTHNTSSTEPQSTPRSAWRAGEVPTLYQHDPTWSQTTYADDNFGTTGCGPTCLAMAYVALTGRTDMTPADMGTLSERLGCASPDGTAWVFMTDGAAEVGLVAEELSADEASVRNALLRDLPVICSVGPGDFTTTGHFIVLTGIDEQGRLLIRDPNSPQRTNKAWDFDTVLAQCRALWAYSAA